MRVHALDQAGRRGAGCGRRVGTDRRQQDRDRRSRRRPRGPSRGASPRGRPGWSDAARPRSGRPRDGARSAARAHRTGRPRPAGRQPRRGRSGPCPRAARGGRGGRRGRGPSCARTTPPRLPPYQHRKRAAQCARHGGSRTALSRTPRPRASGIAPARPPTRRSATARATGPTARPPIAVLLLAGPVVRRSPARSRRRAGPPDQERAKITPGPYLQPDGRRRESQRGPRRVHGDQRRDDPDLRGSPALVEPRPFPRRGRPFQSWKASASRRSTASTTSWEAGDAVQIPPKMTPREHFEPVRRADPDAPDRVRHPVLLRAAVARLPQVEPQRSIDRAARRGVTAPPSPAAVRGT